MKTTSTPGTFDLVNVPDAVGAGPGRHRAFWSAPSGNQAIREVPLARIGLTCDGRDGDNGRRRLLPPCPGLDSWNDHLRARGRACSMRWRSSELTHQLEKRRRRHACSM